MRFYYDSKAKALKYSMRTIQKHDLIKKINRLTATSQAQLTDIVIVVIIFVLTWYSENTTAGRLQREHSGHAVVAVWRWNLLRVHEHARLQVLVHSATRARNRAANFCCPVDCNAAIILYRRSLTRSHCQAAPVQTLPRILVRCNSAPQGGEYAVTLRPVNLQRSL